MTHGIIFTRKNPLVKILPPKMDCPPEMRVEVIRQVHNDMLFSRDD
jgi:hypothetical protein